MFVTSMMQVLALHSLHTPKLLPWCLWPHSGPVCSSWCSSSSVWTVRWGSLNTLPCLHPASVNIVIKVFLQQQQPPIKIWSQTCLKFLILLQSEHVLRNVGGWFHLAASFSKKKKKSGSLLNTCKLKKNRNDETGLNRMFSVLENFYQVTSSSAVCVCGEFGDGCGGHVPWDLQERIPPRAADPGDVCGLLPHRTHHVYRGGTHVDPYHIVIFAIIVP